MNGLIRFCHPDLSISWTMSLHIPIFICTKSVFIITLDDCGWSSMLYLVHFLQSLFPPQSQLSLKSVFSTCNPYMTSYRLVSRLAIGEIAHSCLNAFIGLYL